MTALESLKNDVLRECEDDHVGLWSVVRDVRERFPNADDAEVRLATLTLLEELLSADLIVAGHPTADGRRFVRSTATLPSLSRSEPNGRRWDEPRRSERSSGSRRQHRIGLRRRRRSEHGRPVRTSAGQSPFIASRTWFRRRGCGTLISLASRKSTEWVPYGDASPSTGILGAGSFEITSLPESSAACSSRFERIMRRPDPQAFCFAGRVSRSVGRTVT